MVYLFLFIIALTFSIPLISHFRHVREFLYGRLGKEFVISKVGNPSSAAVFRALQLMGGGLPLEGGAQTENHILGLIDWMP